MNRWAKVFAAICVCQLAGCAGNGKDSRKAATSPSIAPSEPQMMTVTLQRAGPGDPRDPQPQIHAMVHLDIFMHEMPIGTVSNNKAFWKMLDEQAIGVTNADRLRRNGVRCGVAPASTWYDFQRFFQIQPNHARKMYLDGLHMQTVELPMQKQFDQQNLFFINIANRLEGRSYSDGENDLALTFGPAPRDPTAIRLTLCPFVRSHKTRLSFTQLNQEIETPVQDVDRVYDLKLSADLPIGSFLIISPTVDASPTTSVGGCFFEKADKSEMLEQVIVIAPTFIQTNGSPTTLRNMLGQ